MGLYEPVKLFKRLEIDSRWSLETMEWCSEDINITNFSKILLKFATVFKIFEFFCPFLSLIIITGQRRFFSLADELHNKNLYCEMWKLFCIGILLFQIFVYDLVTNKSRKVVESNFIMEKISSSLPLSVLAGVSFLLLLAHV